MSVLQTLTLDLSTVKMRWQEPYITSGLNEKALASNPRGVVTGFRVVPTVGYSVQILEDALSGLSIANVIDTGNRPAFNLSVIQSGSLFLDLTAQANSTIFLALDAQYAVGSPSAAQLRVVDAAELLLNPDLVVIAKVAVPASPPILPANINEGYAQLAGYALTPSARAPFNMVFNGTFESDADGSAAAGWTSTGTPTVTASTDFARTGTTSLKITIASPSTAAVTSAPVPVAPGEEYNVGAWFRTLGGGLAGTGLQLQVVFYDKGFTPIGLPSPVEQPLTGIISTFTQARARVVAPALAAHAKVQVSIDNTTTGVAYMDDVEFSALHSDAVARSSVFGGSLTVADQYHGHAATGLNYAGGPSWADGTTNPGPITVQAQLDKIIADLAGTSGAPKVGNAPSKILHNVFVNTVLNTSSIDATGNGSGTGIIGRGDPLVAAIGVEGFGSLEGQGVGGFGGTNNSAPAPTAGRSVGGFFVGGGGSGGGDGVFAFATVAGRSGVYANGGGAGGTGVYADSGTNGFGVRGFGHGSGSGGVFQSGSDSTSGTPALVATAQGASSKGLSATSTGTQPAVEGTGSSGNGVGGSFTGVGSGSGVNAQGGATGSGVYSFGGATSGYGVYGEAKASNWNGVFGQAKGNAAGVVGRGDQAGVGTSSIFPIGVTGLGGPGASNGLTTSYGGAGVYGLGGDAQLISSTGGDFYRGTGGFGVQGQGGVGHVGGNGVVGFGAPGYDQALDGGAAPGYGGWFLGSNTAGSVSNTSGGNSLAGTGVYAKGGEGAGDFDGGVGLEVWGGGISSGAGLTGYAIDVRQGRGIRFHNNGNFSVSSTSTPPNTLAATNIVKAWGTFHFSGTTVSALDGFNVASVAWFGPDSAFKITLVNGVTAECLVAMTDRTDYILCHGLNALEINLQTSIGSGGVTPIGNGNIHFIVMGRQTA